MAKLTGNWRDGRTRCPEMVRRDWPCVAVVLLFLCLACSVVAPVSAAVFNYIPVARDDNFEITGDDSFILKPLANDSDGNIEQGTTDAKGNKDDWAVWILSEDTNNHETLATEDPDSAGKPQSFQYTPKPGFRGTDVMKYVAVDSFKDGEFVVDATYHGYVSCEQATLAECPLIPCRADEVRCTKDNQKLIRDGASTISITVVDNKPPVAKFDEASIFNDRTSKINLLENDTDPNENQIPLLKIKSLDLAGIPDGATVELWADKRGVDITPKPAFEGFITFTYIIEDVRLSSQVASVSVEVTDPGCEAQPARDENGKSAGAGVEWAISPVDKVNELMCGAGLGGLLKRTCRTDATWGPVEGVCEDVPKVVYGNSVAGPGEVKGNELKASAGVITVLDVLSNDGPGASKVKYVTQPEFCVTTISQDEKKVLFNCIDSPKVGNTEFKYATVSITSDDAETLPIVKVEVGDQPDLEVKPAYMSNIYRTDVVLPIVVTVILLIVILVVFIKSRKASRPGYTEKDSSYRQEFGRESESNVLNPVFNPEDE